MNIFINKTSRKKKIKLSRTLSQSESFVPSSVLLVCKGKEDPDDRSVGTGAKILLATISTRHQSLKWRVSGLRIRASKKGGRKTTFDSAWILKRRKMARGRGERVRNNETRSKRFARGSRFTFITHCSTRRATRFTAFLPPFFSIFCFNLPLLSLFFLFHQLNESMRVPHHDDSVNVFVRCCIGVCCFVSLEQDRGNSLIVDLKFVKNF